jgi:hypothetical protein
MGAALDQADHTDLRVSHLRLAPPRPGRPPKRLHVRRGVRQSERGPIDRSNPPTAVERAPRTGIGHRRADRREQLLDRLDPQPRTRLPDRRRRRHQPHRPPPPRALQAFGQQSGDFLIALTRTGTSPTRSTPSTGPAEAGYAAPPARSPASTESTSDGGNAVVNTPIATRSDRRPSDLT